MEKIVKQVETNIHRKGMTKKVARIVMRQAAPFGRPSS
jgi:hypothetical protein